MGHVRGNWAFVGGEVRWGRIAVKLINTRLNQGYGLTGKTTAFAGESVSA